MNESNLPRIVFHPVNNTLRIFSPKDEKGSETHFIQEAEWVHDEETGEPLVTIIASEQSADEATQRPLGPLIIYPDAIIEPGQEVTVVMKVSGKDDESLKVHILGADDFR